MLFFVLRSLVCRATTDGRGCLNATATPRNVDFGRAGVPLTPSFCRVFSFFYSGVYVTCVMETLEGVDATHSDASVWLIRFLSAQLLLASQPRICSFRSKRANLQQTPRYYVIMLFLAFLLLISLPTASSLAMTVTNRSNRKVSPPKTATPLAPTTTTTQLHQSSMAAMDEPTTTTSTAGRGTPTASSMDYVTRTWWLGTRKNQHHLNKRTTQQQQSSAFAAKSRPASSSATPEVSGVAFFSSNWRYKKQSTKPQHPPLVDVASYYQNYMTESDEYYSELLLPLVVPN